MGALYRRAGKRILDLAIGVPALAVAAPIIATSVVIVRASSIGAPALFKQERAGRGGKPFTVYKLRTMTNERDRSGNLLPDEQRLTKLGEVLRKTSIDELPQLWNVVRGDMSVVGPRPLYVRYIDRYDDEQRKRLDVRPGVTGWSQVNGRNALDWPTKLALDSWYAQNVSLVLDLQILAKTALIVLARSGYAPEGQARIPEFMGNAAAGNAGNAGSA